MRHLYFFLVLCSSALYACEQDIELKPIDVHAITMWKNSISKRAKRLYYAKWGVVVTLLGTLTAIGQHCVDDNMLAKAHTLMSNIKTTNVIGESFDKIKNASITQAAAYLAVSVGSTTMNLMAVTVLTPIAGYYLNAFLRLCTVPGTIMSYDQHITHCNMYLEQLDKDAQILAMTKHSLSSDKKIIIISVNHIMRGLEELLGFMQFKRDTMILTRKDEACVIESRIVDVSLDFITRVEQLIQQENTSYILFHEFATLFMRQIMQELQRFSFLEKN